MRQRDLELVEAAARDVDASQLRISLLEPLQRFAGAGPVFVSSADPVTMLLTGAASVGVSRQATKEFLAHEYGAPDLLRFTDVASAQVPVQSLYGVTRQDPRQSGRWRDLLEPLGWGDELRVALRDRAGVWGFLCLHRERDEPPFSEEERTALGRLLPVLTAAFRRTAALSAPGFDTGGPGVVLIRADLSVEATTGSASELLGELRDTSPYEDLPIPLAALATRLLTERTPQSLTTRTAAGRWVTLHAALLDGPGPARVAIVAEPPTGGAILPALAAAAGWTPRETVVAGALLRGQSTRLTARALQVSELTLQTQIRAVLAKTGVGSRAELVARILGHA